jgi:hypothetical protein
MARSVDDGLPRLGAWTVAGVGLDRRLHADPNGFAGEPTAAEKVNDRRL